MPISDDIKRFYPDGWGEIRKTVLVRATTQWFSKTCRRCDDDLPDQWMTVWHRDDESAQPIDICTPCCEWCKRPDHALSAATPNGWFMDVVVGCSECGWMFETDIWAQPDGLPFIENLDPDLMPSEYKHSKVVLTVAHLDQDPRGDDIDRLRALCQRCHLAYDARPEQRARRERIYAELRGQETLFGGVL